MGSAFKNKGVQPLLDAVTRFLPSPLDREVRAKQYDNPTEPFPLAPDPSKPLVGMAFKIVEDPFGQLTFMRIYQGTIKKGEMYVNQRTRRRNASAASSRCTPTSAKKSIRRVPATSSR